MYKELTDAPEGPGDAAIAITASIGTASSVILDIAEENQLAVALNEKCSYCRGLGRLEVAAAS